MGQAKQEIAATPQRPSFSTSTTTTHAGWLELEAGVSVDKKLIDSPLVLKLGATQNFELFAGFSPLIRVSDGISEAGSGDVFLGGRWRFKGGTAKSPSFAGQFSLKLPTADQDKQLGSGRVDYNLLFIAAHSFRGFGLDFNTGLTLAGIPDGGTDEQASGILTLSRTIASNLSGFAELFVNHSFEFGETTVIGSAGGSYAVNPRFVLDGAINFNISNAPFDLRILGGATVTVTNIW
ncbi:MAG: hypothetical protein ACE5NG_03085 [bacterium]